MDAKRCVKPTFVVIGKEGSTESGENFVSRLWEDANAHFSEIAHLAKRDGDGNLVGIWGAMSDCSHSFLPWQENFKKGLYLAGVECVDDAQAPAGFTKWTVPGFEYLYVENSSTDTFEQFIIHMRENQIPLVGAQQDFNCPKTGKGYLFFPIRKL